jgi:hypothetical protein
VFRYDAKIRCTNPPERLNGDIERCGTIIGNVANDESITRLDVGAGAICVMNAAAVLLNSSARAA